MKIQAKRLRSAVPALMLALSWPSLPVWSDDSAAANPTANVELQAERASEDKVPASPPALEEPKKLLNGQVSKDGVDERVPFDNVNANMAVPPVNLKDALKMMSALREMAKNQNTTGIQEAVRGLRDFAVTINGQNMVVAPGTVLTLRSQRPRLSSDQYRKMEYGIVGMESIVQFNGPPMVSHVLPTCPAANAGIQPGDMIVKANGYVFKRGDGQRQFWQAVCGKADTPVDVTILRNGELITFHLTRMNIEDIKDEPIRGMYEDLLSALGPPDGGKSDRETLDATSPPAQ